MGKSTGPGIELSMVSGVSDYSRERELIIFNYIYSAFVELI